MGSTAEGLVRSAGGGEAVGEAVAQGGEGGDVVVEGFQAAGADEPEPRSDAEETFMAGTVRGDVDVRVKRSRRAGGPAEPIQAGHGPARRRR
ncbi:hypothetical protein FAIPA1_60042 [Frankia sp. AiPs1]